MKLIRMFGASAAALLLGASASHAQQDANPAAQPAPAPQTQPAPAPQAQPAPRTEVSPSGQAVISRDSEGAIIPTEDRSKWVGMEIETADGDNVGEVAKVTPSSGATQEIHADIGGFLGFGETRVKLTPEQISMRNGKLVTTLTKDELKNLPKVDG
ncbi:MAG: PRC-barrel domain-containing protein [Hyphomicrobiales bacterium]|nr:PRC-barrel domain-containing protein [Hyphomicrobiales bacterium]